MEILTPTTELDAVNTMMSVIGEAPLNTLEGALTSDAVMARNLLSEISREVQVEGWNWNTEDEYPCAPNREGEIVLPPNCARVHFRGGYGRGQDIVMRGQRLYDRVAHTFKFSSAVYCTITFLLPFEELPEAARRYVLLKAGRIFQDRAVGSDTLHKFHSSDEARARAILYGDERRSDMPNLITGTADGYTWNVLDVLTR